jgi:tetratricopeptide (TPR) repeat protein
MYEQALAEAREALELNPNSIQPITNVIESYIRLNRFDEAQQALDQLMGENPDRDAYRYYAYLLAFIRGDLETANAHISYFAKKPSEPDATDHKAGMAAFNGQWKRSLEFSMRSIELYLHSDRKENAAQTQAVIGFVESQLGRCPEAKRRAESSLATYKARSTLGITALVFSACGDPRGRQTAEELREQYPKDTFINAAIVPLVRATIESAKGNTAGAIEATQPAMRYEFGNVQGIWLNYIRGGIYLRGKSGSEAAAEFRKILDHRGVEPTSPFYNLAHLGLARAALLTGDTSTARTEYQNFFAAWKNADPDLPIFVEAKKEYEKLTLAGSS